MQLRFSTSSTLYHFGHSTVELVHPDPDEVRAAFLAGATGSQPYWSAVWPSAIALCHFIAGRPELFMGRDVWEPGAGLALPSLLVSRFAARVVAGDISAEAVEMMKASARVNGIGNLRAVEQDWNSLPE